MRRGSFLKNLGRIEGLPVIVVTVLLIAIFMILAPTVFLKWNIYRSFLNTVPPQVIVALGLTLIITAGEIDLSFPAIGAFAGFVFAWTFRTLDPAWSIWAALVLSTLVGVLAGYINGIMVARLRMPSIMATLATYFFWYGVTNLLSNGAIVTLKNIGDNPVKLLLVGRLSDTLPPQSIWAMLMAVCLWFILNRHKFGEAIMFIGDNANVARVMGINVEVTKIQLFTLQGLIAAFGGVLLTLNVGASYPTQGQGILLYVMAAVFMGGTSIAGGYGSMVGSFFGAYIVNMLEPAITAMPTGNAYIVPSVQGFIIAVSVVLNTFLGDKESLSAIVNRVRHWSTPAAPPPVNSVSPRGDSTVPQ